MTALASSQGPSHALHGTYDEVYTFVHFCCMSIRWNGLKRHPSFKLPAPVRTIRHTHEATKKKKKEGIHVEREEPFSMQAMVGQFAAYKKFYNGSSGLAGVIADHQPYPG